MLIGISPSFPEVKVVLGQQPEQRDVPAAGAAPEALRRPILMGISGLAAMVVLLVGTLVEFFLAQVSTRAIESVSRGVGSERVGWMAASRPVSRA